MRHVLLGSLCVAALAGCDSGGLARNASYVGDRQGIALDETVVTVPLAGAEARQANLHISLVVMLNPRRAALSTYEGAASIVRRTGSRISDALIARAQREKAISLAELPALRSALVEEAEAVLRTPLSQWAHGADFKVEFLVTSFFLTDDSVGKARRPPVGP